MAEESLNVPVPLSDMLLTLQRELSRVNDESSVAAEGESRALITEDVSFKIQFKFTPVPATGEGDEATIDSILVDEEGAHEMVLEGKISTKVELR
ncbi:hypothetical protein [Pelagicoccus albus]|uniref:Uncharacterized protein n=2 Tax=Pelagicoccus albus TaxID=415222 RepID=A0A7X1B7Y1_9BACT|nr:hypothetical protein [Pelagicoccus albus]